MGRPARSPPRCCLHLQPPALRVLQDTWAPRDVARDGVGRHAVVGVEGAGDDGVLPHHGLRGYHGARRARLQVRQQHVPRHAVRGIERAAAEALGPLDSVPLRLLGVPRGPLLPRGARAHGPWSEDRVGLEWGRGGLGGRLRLRLDGDHNLVLLLHHLSLGHCRRRRRGGHLHRRRDVPVHRHRHRHRPQGLLRVDRGRRLLVHLLQVRLLVLQDPRGAVPEVQAVLRDEVLAVSAVLHERPIRAEPGAVRPEGRGLHVVGASRG
mmetsp:Transcript_99052/g.166899  ORF Transcript_99052/g.166899 Transcript_99052/m.166899 type:complete len:265 (-) Transcript_99052:1128-1922(-)